MRADERAPGGFEMDVTDLVRPGENSVVVRATRGFQDVILVEKGAKK